MGTADDMATYNGVADDGVADNGVADDGVADNDVETLSLPTRNVYWMIGPQMMGATDDIVTYNVYHPVSYYPRHSR